MQGLVEKVVHMVKAAGRSETVILGNPFSTKTWAYCKDALPGVSTILPISEVRGDHFSTDHRGFRFWA